MMNIYSKNSDFSGTNAILQPSKETIQFLLNYSKSLKIVKIRTNYSIKLHLN